MKLPRLSDIKTAGDAVSIAQEYQYWASEGSLSYGELAKAQAYFVALAGKFDLMEEFSENGII